ncbi:MAG TPA: asparagine synthase (glutamine-hydrolyzing) [Caulobacteraceae bacterium]
MCGIVGLLSHRLDQAARPLLNAMATALTHRGPDGQGEFVDLEAGIALGHRRLKIIDISSAGDQPMASADGRFVITFNGEIFNFVDLRRRLDSERAIPWRGHSDTEVLVEAIAAWGLDAALQAIEGQFAFGLWDRSARALTLARDRFGEKPLYYGRLGRTFVFASELAAFRPHPDFSGEMNTDVLPAYVRYGYIPHPWSIYRQVAKLPQGATVRLSAADLAGDMPQPRAFWSLQEALDHGRDHPFGGSEDDAVEALDALLRQTVGLRMVADVPLGSLLSGGIDSSLVTALMQSQSPRPVKSFTIGSADRSLDEADHARAIAKHLGTDHTELYVGPDQALAVIPKLAAMYGEPFADSSQIPTALVSALAREHVTVGVAGDGGDELFGGYNRYMLGGAWRRVSMIPRPARAALGACVQAISPRAWSGLAALVPFTPAALGGGRGGDKLHKWAAKLDARDDGDFLDRLLSGWDNPAAILQAPRGTGLLNSDIRLPPAASFSQRAMGFDTENYLPDDILVKVDRASMASSLEVRAPFLDRQVLKFAWSLPMAMKIRGTRGKHILRRVLARYVPSALFERPKQGFAVPIDQWLRGELRPWAEDLLSEARLKRQGLFNPAQARKLWAQHLSGAINGDVRLWCLLMFQSWVDQRPVA